ncbi:MAG: hypothetical protein E7265_02860 [Lachnospiraceae bacterium]|nr:hypothetical protein [Lachnospiraceae bacterium]
MFSKRELKTLSRYCSEDLYKAVLGLIKKQEYSNCVRVINTGMVSSGKSSIFNSLTDSITEEKFPTGAARTTVTADEFMVEHGIVFVDTPGIDVREEDDVLAFDTIASADLILMIHNVKEGDLIRSETDWIERLRDLKGKEFLQQKMIFIGSWIDERDRDGDYEELISKLKEMLYKSAGVEIPFFQVSAKRYLKGKRDMKKALVNKSGINELREYLFSLSDKILETKKDSISDEEGYILQKTIEELVLNKKKRELIIDNIKKNVTEYYQTSFISWETVFSTYKTYKDRLETLKKERSKM